MRIALPVILSALLVSACGSESERDTRDDGPETSTDAGTGGSDAGTTPDAGTSADAGTDAGTTRCTALSSYSGPVGGTARLLNAGKQTEAIGFYGDLLGGDRIAVLMFGNYGTLGYPTGTYDLSDRTKVLVDIYTDSSGTTYTADYKTTSGSLNVTSVSGKFSGVITNATLTSATEPGCTVTIPTMNFEGVFQ